MDDDTKALAGCAVGIIAVLISAFVFQYNVYTFTSKDVSFWLDLLAGLLLLWPRIGKIHFVSLLNIWLFVVCFVGRFILGYQAPWIGQ